MSADPLTPMEMYAAQDARDAKLLALGLHKQLLAHYFDRICDRCEARVWGNDGEDVAQQVLLRLWVELQRGRTYPVPFRVVVEKVMVWTIGGHFVKLKRLPDLLDEIDVVDATVAFTDAIEQTDFLEFLAAAMPLGDAEVFRLRYIHELEPAEIAGRLCKNPNAIHQAVSRCHNLHIPRIIPDWKADA